MDLQYQAKRADALEYSKPICYPQQVLPRQDTIDHTRECGEAKKCLHLGCPLNRTSRVSYADSKNGERAQEFANRYFDKMAKAIESFPAEDPLEPLGL